MVVAGISSGNPEASQALRAAFSDCLPYARDRQSGRGRSFSAGVARPITMRGGRRLAERLLARGSLREERMARGPHSARREKRARAFSVRAHLAAIVGVLAVTLVGLGAFQSSNDFRAARRQANLDTAFQARLAAGALTRSLGDASSFAAGTAGSPSIAQLF